MLKLTFTHICLKQISGSVQRGNKLGGGGIGVEAGSRLYVCGIDRSICKKNGGTSAEEVGEELVPSLTFALGVFLFAHLVPLVVPRTQGPRNTSGDRVDVCLIQTTPSFSPLGYNKHRLQS